jgi:hypothetical protein
MNVLYNTKYFTSIHRRPQPRSGERLQPTAQAVGGKRKLVEPPEGRKNRTFPQTVVTYNLASAPQSRDHKRRQADYGQRHQPAPKPCVIKILTSNPWRLKILQTLSANPAPVKPFKAQGGGGIPLQVSTSPSGNGTRAIFFSTKSTDRNLLTDKPANSSSAQHEISLFR